MNVFGLLITSLLVLTTPALAMEYQGINIDGKKLPARVHSVKTGGVFEAQVQFQGDRATIDFGGGSEMTIRLHQRVITNPTAIVGSGAPGQVPVGRVLSLGLNTDYAMESITPSGLRQTHDQWVINLDPVILNQVIQAVPE